MSVAKELKPDVRKFYGLVPSFVEVTGEKLVGDLFDSPLSWIGLRCRVSQLTSWEILKLF